MGPEVQVVGRHHPGDEDIYGAAANFLYIDGHIERKTIHKTLRLREWGDKFYSISGRNEVKGQY